MSLTIPVEVIVAESTSSLLAIHPTWERIHLSEVASVLNGFAFPSKLFSKTQGTPLIRIRDVGKQQTDCCFDGPFEDKYVIKPGDLIIGMDGDFRCERWNGPLGLLNQRVCRIGLTTEDYDKTFLELVLPAYLDAINKSTSSVTVRHLSSQSIAEIPLPLPPLAEQKRIVAKVETLLARVNAGRQRLAKVPALLKRFRQSVLAAACSGQLTEDWRNKNGSQVPAAAIIKKLAVERNVDPPQVDRDDDLRESWERTTLGFLVEPTLRGRPFITSGSRGWAEYVAEEGPFFIRSENINTEYLRLDDAIRVAPPEGAEAERTRVRPSDLLLTITGNNVGRTAVVPKHCPPAHVSQHVAIIRVDQRCNTDYLWLWLRSPEHGQRQLTEGFYGETKPGLNLEQIRSVWVDFPPLAEQHEIVRRVEALFARADSIEKRLAATTRRVETLTQAILAQAFRGELVPTEAELARQEGRAYEPASALLRRNDAQISKMPQIQDKRRRERQKKPG